MDQAIINEPAPSTKELLADLALASSRMSLKQAASHMRRAAEAAERAASEDDPSIAEVLSILCNGQSAALSNIQSAVSRRLDAKAMAPAAAIGDASACTHITSADIAISELAAAIEEADRGGYGAISADVARRTVAALVAQTRLSVKAERGVVLSADGAATLICNGDEDHMVRVRGAKRLYSIVGRA